ncbi:MAG: hypothetical protein OXN21_06510 [Chloroflexota bacterium]|nr:hypothetical protein [Chloroflexota bacterium]
MSDLIVVAAAPEALSGPPGEQVTAQVQVQNFGRVVDAYSVEVQGLNPDWYVLSTDSVSLFPGDSGQLNLVINIPAGSGATAGWYEFYIRVASGVFPGEETIVPLVVRVEPVSEYHAQVRPELVEGRAGRFTLNVENTGNTEVVLDLDGADPEGFCRFSFSENPATVEPGTTREVQVLAKPRRRPFVEPSRTHSLVFSLSPRQSAERTSLTARLEATPYARKWQFPAALVALLLMAWLGYTLFWFAQERDEITYLREEKWDDLSEAEEISHGRIGMLEFELVSEGEMSVPYPPPIGLRASVSWPNTGDSPPTVGIVVRSPGGTCWGPRMVDRTAEPLHFPAHEGGVPCHELKYGWLLMDVNDPEAPIPSAYGAGEPLTEYCVRDSDKNPTVKFFRDGEFQTPYNLSTDDFLSTVNAGTPVSSAILPGAPEEKWSIYLVNPHPEAQWPVAPELTVRLKAVDKAPHSWKKDETISVQRLELPHPRLSMPYVQCGWDTELDIPAEEGGLEHGVLYVRRVEISPRTTEDGSYEDVSVGAGHYGCPNWREYALESELRLICSDVTWEALDSGQEGITADTVFLILRHSHEGEARCWSRVERHASPDSLGSPFTWDLHSEGRPCHEELTDPQQILWNLMNWNTFEPARYEGVQPLVKFCPHESGQALFDRKSAVPLPQMESWGQNRTSGWTLYVLNPSSDAAPPRVTVKFKGDQFWRVELRELPNSTVGDTPLVPQGSSGCPQRSAG